MPVRSFYDFLVEEGLRESNPVAGAAIRRGVGGAGTSVVWCRG
ncbi:hypothetical protein ABIA38_007932 [Embleya sp. AB8]